MRKDLFKKTTAIVLAGTMILSLAACGKKEADKPADKKDNTTGNDTEQSSQGQEEVEIKIPDGYNLVWSDEFDGDSLNMDDWNYEYHEPGWVNNELQKYVDAPENIYVKDGELVIQPLKTSSGYTSGRVNTQNKHDFKYGRFECKAQVPTGQGFLPAFWMMPTDENLYGQWPKCGEIDIMEVLGNQTNTSYATLHYGEPHTETQGSLTLDSGDFGSEYHVFACEWEPGEIRFYVDNTLVNTVNDWFTKKQGFGEVTFPAPYDQPFYMILNVAVGGNWPGNPDDSTPFDETAALKVDYVRVYQKDEYDENVQKQVQNVKLKEADETGNYVTNGSFEEDEALDSQSNWTFLTAGEGKASASISDGAIHIETENPGDLDYSVQLVQPNMPMVKGASYKFSFDAWADEDRTMITCISAPNAGWIRYLDDTKIDIGTKPQTYTFEIDMKEATDGKARIEFNLGNQPSSATVHITNVRFEKTSGDDTAVSDERGVLPDGNFIYNGEFQEGDGRFAYWEVADKTEGSEYAVTNVNNIREFNAVVAEGSAAEDFILSQSGIKLSTGKEYFLSFDARAKEATTIKARFGSEEFDVALTDSTETYKFNFTAASDAETALEFLLGGAGDVTIDNVRIQENTLLLNGDFSNGMTGYEVYAYTTTDVNYVVDTLNEDSAFSIDILDTGDMDWKIQLKQNNLLLEEGKVYRIKFDAKCTMDRKIMYALQRDGSADDDWTPYSGSQRDDMTSEFKTFETVFKMSYATDAATILSISLGSVSDVQISEKHTVVIDNIVLEEATADEITYVPDWEK